MTTPAVPDRLTLKQQRFIKAYVSNGGNGTQAAIDAGYSEADAAEQAYENLRKPHIAQAIQRLEQDHITSAGLTDAFIISRWMRNMDLALALDKPQISASNQAGELLAKHLRMAGFDRQAEGGNGNTTNIQINVMRQNMSGLSLDELKRLALGGESDDPHPDGSHIAG